MSRLRPVSALARLLDETAAPVYVLDEERRIVYCNPACAQWTGRSIEEVLGQQCGYHPPDDASDVSAAVSGLCPSPEVFSGTRHQAVISTTNAQGQLVRRRVEFLPLGSAEESAAPLLAVVADDDLSADNLAASGEADGEGLHVQVRRFRQEFAARYQLDRLIGASAAMRRVRDQIVLAGGSTLPVLIVGPPGSGKQYVAKAIHYRSNEGAGTLAPLDCATLGAELLESTLMLLTEHESRRGAATTLLLNNIDHMPAEVQARLKRLIDSGSLAARLLTTSIRPLTKAVAAEEFRADLACALSPLMIELPPLAERLEDLPLVAQMFLEEVNSRGGKQLGSFSPEALDRLAAYPWPRNLDELAETIAESHARAQGHEIGVQDLPDRLRLAADAARYPRRAEESIVLEDFLARVERELIERALARAKGNKSRAARLLGLTRPRLYRRLVQLGMIVEEDDTNPKR